MRTIALCLALAALATPALAQRLPRTSPAEREVQDINRSLESQQRRLGEQQRNQIEINQLRQDLNRQRTTPTLTGPGSVGRICAPGQIGC
ncbi:MAG TPA: hypothetical protein VIL09_00900 [Microvirga sp.]|jgi:hypothetical protein